MRVKISLIFDEFSNNSLIYIKKSQKQHFFCRIIWRFVEKVLSLQRQKVNRLFRLVVIDLGF